MKGVVVMVTLFALVMSYTMKLKPRANDLASFEERVQIQPVDHFGSKSTLTFPQRYFVDSTNWGGPKSNAPILVFLGGPDRIEDRLGTVGTLNLAAARFKALAVYIEHRFYGKSVPLESIVLALAHPKVRGCLTVEQSLHDFANLISRLKQNFSIPNAKVIVFGASYSGMLAAWFKMKYPHIANGALASSAPLLIFEKHPGENQPCYIASKVVREKNEKCHDRIIQSWKLLDEHASPAGRGVLDQTFNSCSPLQSVRELKKYLADMYMFTVQYNGRFNEKIDLVCGEIVKSSNILEGVANAVSALNPDQSCFNISTGAHFILDPPSQKAWDWQLCSQLVYPIFCPTGTMFPPYQFNMAQYGEDCRKKYGVYPRPQWMWEFYASLERPQYVSLERTQVPEESSKPFSINTEEGSHALDMNQELPDDPTWLTQQRQQVVDSIARWV